MIPMKRVRRIIPLRKRKKEKKRIAKACRASIVGKEVECEVLACGA
jgi:hypothetical protein